ncbi:MAG: hypothetical protein L6265_10125 [Thermoplasmatales archaeon]|nr:hypothetical protein [Candidatus Thermoplasmatota archaeon]MCG2826934.1 hypothetical protein [Thermoplasmatales archaeon]
MDKGKLLLKVETKDFRQSNIHDGLLLLSALLLLIIVPIMLPGVIRLTGTPIEKTLYVGAFFMVGFFGVSILIGVLGVGFRRKFFEIYENGFTPINKHVREILTKKTTVMMYTTVTRVAKYEKEMNVTDFWTGKKKEVKQFGVTIYGKQRKWTTINNSMLPEDVIKKLIDIIKKYSEKEKTYIFWIDR